MRRLAQLALEVLVFTVPWQAAVTLSAVGRGSRLVGLVALAVALDGAGGGRAAAAGGAGRVAVGGHVAVAAASWFWSRSAETTLVHVATLAQLLAMVLLLGEFGDRPRARVRLLLAWVLGCWVGALLTWQSYLSGTEAGGGGYRSRYAIGDGNVNDVGLTLALGIPLAW